MAGRTVVLRPSGGIRPAAAAAAAAASAAVVDMRVKEGEEVEGVLMGWALTNTGWNVGDGDAKAGIQVFRREGTRNHSPTTSPTEPKDLPKSYQLWKCCGEVAGLAEDVYRLMVDTAVMPRWNHDVTSYRVVEKINEQTDVVQCISAASASGAVSPRDFVILRRRTRPDPDTFVIADTGTTHTKATPSPDGSVVRGWNGPGGIVIRKLPSTNGKHRCWVCWVLNKDLRGWLPRSLVDQVLAAVLKDWIKNLRSATANIHSFFPPPVNPPPPTPTPPTPLTTPVSSTLPVHSVHTVPSKSVEVTAGTQIACPN
jgi:hypothetical protein